MAVDDDKRQEEHGRSQGEKKKVMLNARKEVRAELTASANNAS